MIGIIAAMEEEMSLLKETLECEDAEVIQGIKFYEGHIANHLVVVCSSGVGKVNAAMATSLLIERFECHLIINTGIAGGITDVSTRDIIIASQLMYSDVNATPFGYAYGQIPGMPKAFLPSIETITKVKQTLRKLNLEYKDALVYSADTFVSSLEPLANVDIKGTCIAEMEGAAVAQVCTRAGVDFIVLRYVSDIVGSQNQLLDYQSFESEMANRSSKICLEIIKNLE